MMNEETEQIVNRKEDLNSTKRKESELYLQIIAGCCLIIVFAIFCFLVYILRRVLGLFALSFLLSYTVSPAVKFLERRGINRLTSVSLLYFFFVAIIVVTSMLLIPVIGDELRNLQDSLQYALSDPNLSDKIVSNIESFQERLGEAFPSLKGLDLRSQIDVEKWIGSIASWITNYLGQLLKAMTSYSSKIVLVGIAVFLIPFISFFLLKDGNLIKQSLLKVVPRRYTEPAVELLVDIDHQIGRFIRGKIAESIILSVLTIITLRILNIKYYLLIGSIAGFANLIPYIGPVVIAIPPVLLAGYQFGFIFSVITALAFIGLQFIDNFILVPFIVGKSVDLHPIVTVFVVLIGGEMLGLLGMVAAVPLTSIIVSIFQAVSHEFSKVRNTG